MVQTEIIRHEFSQRLIKALSDANYPAHGRGIKLARELGVSSKAVSKWLSGEAFPRPAMMKALAKTLNVDHLWLQHGEEAHEHEYRLMNTLFSTRAPLISWQEVDDVEAFLKRNFDKVKYFFSGSVMKHNHAFWLIVKDDSMTSLSGMCVPERSMILVDPTRTPESGQLVIARLETAKEATFKQFIVDEGTNRCYLKPLNNHYKPVEIDNTCTFIGVVIESRMNFVDPDPAEDTPSY